MCFPGTGSVVMYMVMQRYMYSVPIRKKQRRPMIALQTGSDITQSVEKTKIINQYNDYRK